MMVSLIQSNYMGFGSGVVVPGTGISLQNRGAGFSLAAGSSERGRPAASGPFHTIIPGFLTRDGAPLAAFGVMGGPIQPPGHVQTLVRLLIYGMNPQAASDAPRWKVNGGLASTSKPARRGTSRGSGGAGPPDQVGRPTRTWTSAPASSSSASTAATSAASDPRRDGQAAGF